MLFTRYFCKRIIPIFCEEGSLWVAIRSRRFLQRLMTSPYECRWSSRRSLRSPDQGAFFKCAMPHLWFDPSDIHLKMIMNSRYLNQDDKWSERGILHLLHHENHQQVHQEHVENTLHKEQFWPYEKVIVSVSPGGPLHIFNFNNRALIILLLSLIQLNRKTNVITILKKM